MNNALLFLKASRGLPLETEKGHPDDEEDVTRVGGFPACVATAMASLYARNRRRLF